MMFARKILFPEFFGAIPGSKAESERTRPQHQLGYVIMVDIVLRAKSCLCASLSQNALWCICAVLGSHVVRPSVRPSVCPSVCDVGDL